MNLTRTMKDLENVYIEKVEFPPKGTFEMAGKSKEVKSKKAAFISKPSGPAEASGVQVEISDPKTLGGKETFQGTEKLSSQNFNEKSEKSEQKEISNFMSKSIFDKLFEDVMGANGAQEEAKDAMDLGIDVGAEPAAEEGDVTITLSRDMAKKLHDVLMSVLGDEADDEAAGESEDAEGHGHHDKEAEEAEGYGKPANHMAGEATEMTELKPAAGQALQGKSNKVGGVVDSLVAKGGGDGKVKSEVDGKGTDAGHALVGSGVKGGAPTSPKGKANVVAGKASNVGHYLFQK